MTIIKEPAIYYPDNTIKNDDIISFIEEYHSDSEYIDAAKNMILNTTIEQRYLFESFESLMEIEGFAERQYKHEAHAKSIVSSVAMSAIDNAKISKKDISMVIVTSCTGFMMPSLTAFLINELGLKNTTIQLPISQMGCAGGAYAINRAHEHCMLNKNNNVLIVAFETSSLCFHKTANKLQDFVSDSIFGDGVASCIVSGNDLGSGLIIESINSVFIKNSEDFIKYHINNDGFLFSLDKKVMKSVSMIKNDVNDFIALNLGINDMSFCISHTGGKRILDEVSRCFNIPEDLLQKSRESLRMVGNTSSVSVIDVFKRHIGTMKNNDRGLLIAFGPGFTAEMMIGRWVGE